MDPVYLQDYPDYTRPNRGRDPNSYNTVRDIDSIWKETYNLTVGFLFELYATVIWRVDSIRTNFFHDFFQTKSIWYPFLGVFQFLICYRYWYYGLVTSVCYLILFFALLWLYAAFLLPILAGWQILLLGPVGLAIAVLQMLLQCNAWTLRGVRNFVLPKFTNDIFELTLLRKGQIETLNSLKRRQLPACPELHLNNIEFWIHDVPFNTFSFLRWLFVFIFITLISLLPIVGPLAATILQTPDRAYGYYDVWMIRRRLSDKAKRDEYYSRLGQLWAFGLTAGLLELIPGFSALLMISNVIAVGVWANDDIKLKRVQL